MLQVTLGDLEEAEKAYQARPKLGEPESAPPLCRDVGGYEAYMTKTGKVCRLNRSEETGYEITDTGLGPLGRTLGGGVRDHSYRFLVDRSRRAAMPWPGADRRSGTRPRN